VKLAIGITRLFMDIVKQVEKRLPSQSRRGLAEATGYEVGFDGLCVKGARHMKEG